MKKKILVIDDDEAMRWLIKKMLEKEYTVDVFSHVANALKHMNQYGHPDVIVTDIHLPVIDGKDFLSNLKTNGLYSAIPVVVISSFKDEQTKSACLEAGADDYIMKPFNPEKLIERINNIINNKRKENTLIR
ncbi:putative two-component system response regulator [Fulvivirga imtechensis AK7]|uniref:Putative two-component system response regulator n=1 Tax=Fulvivirga imtechensis AK7 TaxID=1237149 RepID=L8JYV9_9BACT|nr:response regulator [Fulvivirga imtechensis]ELR73358.1 putative two-component system response regulator [Fulvivirga imtechensis AK7]